MRFCLCILSLCWASALIAQSAQTSKLPLAGCYEVRVLQWSPPLEDEPHFPPSRLQLTAIPLEGDQTAFRVQSLPVAPSGSTFEQQWFWVPEGRRLTLSFGFGLGGMRGAFKASSNADLSGKLKQWCDKRCDFKKTEITMSLRRIDCPK